MVRRPLQSPAHTPMSREFVSLVDWWAATSGCIWLRDRRRERAHSTATGLREVGASIWSVRAPTVGIAVAEDYAYVTWQTSSARGLEIIDVSDPSAPSFVLARFRGLQPATSPSPAAMPSSPAATAAWTSSTSAIPRLAVARRELRHAGLRDRRCRLRDARVRGRRGQRAVDRRCRATRRRRR